MANIPSFITEKELTQCYIDNIKGLSREDAEIKVAKIFKWLAKRRHIVQSKLLHLEVEEPKRDNKIDWKNKSPQELIELSKTL